MQKVLIIDDHYAIRKSFELAYLDSEYELFTAVSGIEGLKIIKQEAIQLVFLDLKMPVINGIETFKEIRLIDKNVFIYFITAFHPEFFEDLEKLIKDGHEFELLQKPIDNDNIIKLSESVLID